MNGLHLLADLQGCRLQQPAMTNASALAALCSAAVAAAGLTEVAVRFHAFEPVRAGEPAGVTGVVLLSESHLAIHTWPELGAVTLDVYVCNVDHDNSDKARALLQTLIDAFAPQQSQVQSIQRGSKHADATIGPNT
ncbi:MAG: adenosylmethionine decarboxylase [Burkholderiales bacterium]|jgi:S-adenosylmethionine decarboxylase proenzyme